jgi:hypothetical protein
MKSEDCWFFDRLPVVILGSEEGGFDANPGDWLRGNRLFTVVLVHRYFGIKAV